MKENVLFAFYEILDLLVYNDDNGEEKRWTQIEGCIEQNQLPITQVHIFYFIEDIKLFEKMLKKLQEKYKHIHFSYDVFDCDQYDTKKVAQFVYKYILTYKYDTSKYNYYFTHPKQATLRTFMFYYGISSRLACQYMIPFTPISSEYRSQQILLRSIDLSVYRDIAYECQQHTLLGYNVLLGGIQSKHPEMLNIVSEMENAVANSRGPLLLYGSTGSGKTRIAQQMAKLLKEKGYVQGPFIEVNCATLNNDLAASQLFGHVKGAFTGAIANYKGLLASANNGVLFLDEISLLDMQCQGMLLRAIEDGIWFPIGSETPVYGNFFLICASNVDLVSASKQGLFREDLLARISMWEYSLPSLKERSIDFEAYLDYELNNISTNICSLLLMHKEAKKMYIDFARSKQSVWRYNLRDLHASVQRMAAHSTDGRITVDIVSREMQYLKSNWIRWQNTTTETFELSQSLLDEEIYSNLDYFELVQLEAVLQECKKYKTLAEAGRTLFNKSRQIKSTQNDSHRLRLFLKKYNITWQMIQD
ncbi:sigma 54-interacting transcriptional regulator [Desulfovibrio litoralis]|uniref:Transcriptional regulatory protein RtcR n=1 Tax=Desulfovibrio litoralis DSM 11393 TaxID=1121455 RepID=A0A1M7SMS4_9BACT|nr:sigma 54-interacting transcriptional regulator [Desulfovibrio litoralis]SHN59772.1 transcriptional regulatory protein RtcR [Desulfovibrio litoralis DSM 11393]